jgi:hypothetical protein
MLENEQKVARGRPCGRRMDTSQSPDGARREGAALMNEREIRGRELVICNCSPVCPCQLNSLRAEDYMTQSSSVG